MPISWLPQAHRAAAVTNCICIITDYHEITQQEGFRHRGYYIRNTDTDMRNKQEWFNEKMAAVSPEIMSEVQLSADIIARIDAVLKQKNMTQRDLAKKMGRSEAVISRWTSGFPNLTLKSIAEISTALGEPLVRVTE